MTKQIDWDEMQREWVAGIVTVKSLSEKYGISRAAIIKHWAKAGVERDLAAKIKAKADSIVTRAQVTRKVTQFDSVTEREVIEANAQSIAVVDLEHRAGCARARKTLERLHEDFDALPIEDPLDKRIASFQKMIAAQETLYALERKILKLDQADAITDQSAKSVEVRFV